MRKILFVLLVMSLVCLGAVALAQQASSQQPAPAQKPADQKPPADVTGPDRPVGESVTIPTKRPPPKPKAKAPAEQAKPGEPPFAVAVDVNLVTLDVTVADKNGHFIPNLGKKNFRVIEDGVPQQVQTFGATEAPMTVVMLVEFDNLYMQFWTETWYQTLTAAYGFLDTLRLQNCVAPNQAAPGRGQSCDWLAIVAYDLKPEILQDFTQSREAAQGALQRLQFPAFSEACMYDALNDVLNRLQDVEGKKGVVLIATGIDTFSKLTYDKILKKVQSSEVPIYPIGLMQSIREIYDARGWMGPIQRMDFLQADNALRTFASYSGGAAYFPRFYGEMPGIFQNIAGRMRNQYTIGYAPTNTARDGKFRKVKVEIVDENGQILKVVDQKGKEVKYQVYARNGYYAPKGEVTVQ